MKLAHVFSAWSWFSLVTPSIMAQQPSPTDRCAKAAQEVMSGQAGARGVTNALIVECPEGPAIIAARWRASTTRPEDLQQLLTWNLQLMDQRIADAAMATAHDVSRPTRTRLTALQVLVSYFDAAATVGASLGSLDNPPKGRMLGSVMDFAPRMGSEPPGRDLPGRVYALNRDLAGDADPAVARAALYLWQAMTDARPGLASIPVGTVILENVCGQKFRIANHNDIDLSFDLATGSGQRPMGVRVPAQASRDMTVNAKDTVRLRFAGRDIAQATVGAPCLR
jgi:hypothetical protein